MGTEVGEVIGMSKVINSIDFKPTRPFRLVTGSEDFTACFFEGPPFKFVRSLKVTLLHSSARIKIDILIHFSYTILACNLLAGLFFNENVYSPALLCTFVFIIICYPFVY